MLTRPAPSPLLLAQSQADGQVKIPCLAVMQDCWSMVAAAPCSRYFSFTFSLLMYVILQDGAPHSPQLHL
jgi:hypothetical protein